MKSRRAIVALCTLLAVAFVAVGPAQAAPKAKKPKAPKLHATGVWMGQIERHGKHFDYVGSGCPVDAQVCTTQVVRYRINPTTADARRALTNYGGGAAVILADLRPAKDRRHTGVLLARLIATQPATPSVSAAPGAPGDAGVPGQSVQGATVSGS